MSTNAELYEKDFYAWTQETAALIAAGKWHEIDQALLADEVAGLGRDDQREIARCVQRVLKELLLWWALPGERKGTWAAAIIEERARLEDTVEDGLVLFLTDQAIVLPVQVELYDDTNTLVSRHKALG